MGRNIKYKKVILFLDVIFFRRSLRWNCCMEDILDKNLYARDSVFAEVMERQGC